MRGFLGSFTTSRKGRGQSHQVRWREFPTGKVGIESYLEFTEQGFREDVYCRIVITVDNQPAFLTDVFPFGQGKVRFPSTATGTGLA